MKISKKELDEMRGRVADGTANDEDRRLVDLYADEDGSDTEDGAAGAGHVTGSAEAEVVRPTKSTRRASKP